MLTSHPGAPVRSFSFSSTNARRIFSPLPLFRAKSSFRNPVNTSNAHGTFSTGDSSGDPRCDDPAPPVAYAVSKLQVRCIWSVSSCGHLVSPNRLSVTNPRVGNGKSPPEGLKDAKPVVMADVVSNAVAALVVAPAASAASLAF